MPFDEGTESISYPEKAELQSLLLDSDPDGILLCSSEGRLLACNQTVCRLYKNSKNRLLELKLDDLLELNKQSFFPLNKNWKEEEFHQECTGRTLNGEQLVLQVFAKRVFFQSSYFLYVKLQNAGKARGEVEKEINKEEAPEDLVLGFNDDVEQLVHLLSHEFREPLMTLRGFATLLQNKYLDELDKNGRRALGFIKGTVGRLDAVLGGLLQYYQLGKLSELSLVDVGEILEKVLAELQEELLEIGASTSIEGEMPKLFGRRAELYCLLRELLRNAILFRNHEKSLDISISVKRDRGFWTFVVKDNGIGIRKGAHNKIFKLFQRLHKSKDFQGSGVGLAHCRKIVELHQGDIWIDSEPSKGCTVFFTIGDMED